jgi:hypothetical protein
VARRKELKPLFGAKTVDEFIVEAAVVVGRTDRGLWKVAFP